MIYNWLVSLWVSTSFQISSVFLKFINQEIQQIFRCEFVVLCLFFSRNYINDNLSHKNPPWVLFTTFQDQIAQSVRNVSAAIFQLFFKSSRDLPDSLNILLLFHWHLTDCFIHLLKEDSFESLLKTLECYLWGIPAITDFQFLQLMILILERSLLK